MLAIEAMATSFNNLIPSGMGGGSSTAAGKCKYYAIIRGTGEGGGGGRRTLAGGEPFAIYFPLISVFICLLGPLVDNVGGK